MCGRECTEAAIAKVKWCYDSAVAVLLHSSSPFSLKAKSWLSLAKELACFLLHPGALSLWQLPHQWVSTSCESLCSMHACTQRRIGRLVCRCHQLAVPGEQTFLKQVVKEGIFRPPLVLEIKICARSADLLRPCHFFGRLVTGGSSVCSTQVSGRSARERSHVRQGQTAS